MYTDRMQDPDEVGEAAYRAVYDHLREIEDSEVGQYGEVSEELLERELRALAAYAEAEANRLAVRLSR